MNGFRLLGSVLILALSSQVAAHAQVSITFRSDGPDYTASNEPFTLAQTIHSETRLQNGSPLRAEATEKITRDAQGRLFVLYQFVPADPLKSTPQRFILVDPQAGTLTQWQQGVPQAVQSHMPPDKKVNVRVLWADPMARIKLPASVVPTTESLGTQEIAGLQTTGTRTTTVLPAGMMGNTEPLRIVHEVWISDALHVPLRELDINPLSGTRTMTTDKAERTPREAVLFHVPAGLPVKVLGTPGAAAADRAKYDEAMQQIKAPETREAAADELVQYAQAHEEVANRVAHTLALRKTHLAEAKSLAEASVTRLEQATSSLTLSTATPSTHAEMSDLAEYWDSLGAVYAALGDPVTAERYFRDAWALGGEGLYLDHLAILQESAGDKEAAKQTDAVALSGKVDAREADQIRRRAQRLGVSDPKPVAQPTVVPVAGVKATRQAEIDLLFTGSAPPEVHWVSGDDALKAQTKALAAASYPKQTPDAGPEHVLRRGRLECAADNGCHLTLLYTWQAEDEVNAKLRPASLGSVSPSN